MFQTCFYACQRSHFCYHVIAAEEGTVEDTVEGGVEEGVVGAAEGVVGGCFWTEVLWQC